MSYGNPGGGRGRDQGGNRRGPDRGHGGQGKPPRESLDTSGIQIRAEGAAHLPADLFDTVAQNVAKNIAAGGSSVNKPSQLRQFYDELVMWEERVRRDESRFAEYLPFIRMLNAKAAYAEGRKHVDRNFVDFMHHCLGQVDSAGALRNFKLFFEAFMGFYKVERPSG